MPKCPECEALYGVGDDFCPECGEKLSKKLIKRKSVKKEPTEKKHYLKYIFIPIGIILILVIGYLVITHLFKEEKIQSDEYYSYLDGQSPETISPGRYKKKLNFYKTSIIVPYGTSYGLRDTITICNFESNTIDINLKITTAHLDKARLGVTSLGEVTNAQKSEYTTHLLEPQKCLDYNFAYDVSKDAKNLEDTFIKIEAITSDNEVYDSIVVPVRRQTEIEENIAMMKESLGITEDEEEKEKEEQLTEQEKEKEIWIGECKLYCSTNQDEQFCESEFYHEEIYTYFSCEISTDCPAIKCPKQLTKKALERARTQCKHYCSIEDKEERIDTFCNKKFPYGNNCITIGIECLSIQCPS